MRLPCRHTGLILVIALTLAGVGCTRKFYRKRADDDVVGLLTEKNQSPAWAIESWYIYPDPRSRFADPSKPDRPPKPPDDPGAYALSPDPQPRGPKRTRAFEGTGYLDYLEVWDAENRARDSQRDNDPNANVGEKGYSASDSFEQVLRTQERPFRISLDHASELALFNSREYQDRREDLFVAALPVSLERFSFVAQFKATETAVREVTGSKTSDGAGNRWRLNSQGEMSKLFPSGATLLVKLANRLVIELGQNGKPTVGLSTLTAELSQPLLAGGGFAVTMEPLTQAERNLLYAVRSYARFRKIYYTFLAGGNDNLFNNPYSFAGLSLRGVGPTLNAPGQGYYPTLLLDALVRNEVSNISALERYWRVFQAYEEGGDVSRLQVDQVEQQLLRSRTQLLQRRLDLQNAQDQFKLQLGVPTPLPLELDDSLIRPITNHLNRFDRIRIEFDAVRDRAASANLTARQGLLALGGGPATYMPINIELRPVLRDLFTRSAAVRGTRFALTIGQLWQRWERLTDDQLRNQLRTLGDQQRDLLEQKARLEVNNKSLARKDELELGRLRAEINLGRLEASLRRFERKPWLKEPGPRQAREQDNAFRETIDLFNLVLGEARAERLSIIRDSWPDLPPVMVDGIELLGSDLDVSQTVAAQAALANRLELMNARAQVVDSWRQIAVRANALMGVLNVGYNYDTTSPDGANNPLNLGDGRNRHQLVLNGELPLVRRAERNAYRTALIAYQRQRRALQATEDNILNDVRANLRQLRVAAENYKIQLRAVEVAYAQVENSLEALQAPPDPRNLAGGQTAGNAAALTLQLLNAQNSLVQSQNALYTVWVNYLIARMQFYLSIELLPLDPRGVWIDEYNPNRCGEPSGPRRPREPDNPGELPQPERIPDVDPPAIQPASATRIGNSQGGPNDPIWRRSEK